MKRSDAVTWALVLLALIISFSAYAADAPHNAPASGFNCSTCHITHIALGSTGYNNICMNCHRPGNPVAGINPFAVTDAADPFKTHSTAGLTRLQQTSHRWDGTDVVPAAGAQGAIQGPMTTAALRSRSGNGMACVRCHSPHYNTYGKFLRIPNDQDQLCLDCHRSRNVQSHLQGSHPVSINYDTAAAAKPGSFNTPPFNANPANPTSSLDSRLTATNRTLLCSTCHGVHYTDSHSGTVDGRDNFANLSSGDGFLLRTDTRGAKVTSGQPDKLNICTNCHANKRSHNLKGQDVQCVDCHGAHVDYDPNDPNNTKGTNIYLVRRNVTKAGQPSQIFFRYTGSQREYVNAQGTGVCQGCHDVPPPGGNYPPQHASQDARVCNSCHFHNSPTGSFSKTCAVCHGYPPITTDIGGATGMAAPGTNALGGTPANAGAHATHVTSRGMSCNACHNGYDGKPMPSQTIDIGFAINGSNFPGFAGSATGGAFSGTSNLTGYTWSAGPGTTLTTVASANNTCSVYCHGSTLTGGTTTNPSWTGTGQAACGACHGVSATSPPATGGHSRHAGNGTGGLSLGCNFCHGVVTDNSHVNGTVTWDLTSLGGGAQYKTPNGTFAPTGGTGALAPSASYGQCTNIYCHSNVQGANGIGAATGYGQPTWGGAALTCGSCHQDMASDPGAPGSHVKHAQVNAIPCATCHNGLGHNAPTHADGSINLAFSAAGSGTTYSKGTTFAPGSGYGTCTNVSCHGALPNSATWGGALGCQDCHFGATDVDVFTVPFTTASPVAAINTNEWTSSGHGRTAGTYASGNPAAGFSGANQCLYCHDTTVSHNNPANVFRMLNYSTADFGRNAPCLVCHAKTGSTTVLGATATRKIASGHYGAKHGSGNNGGYFCWDCHDPHGDGNVYMIHNQVAKTSDRASGVPTAPVNVAFSAFATGSDFAGTATSLCNACHTSTAHYSSTNPNDGHNIATACTSCHNHNGPDALSAFAPGGGACDSCHGYPPAAAGFSGTQGNWSSARTENYPGGGGAHTVLNHVSPTARPADGFANCAKCHNQADHRMSPVAFTPSQNIKVTVNQSYRFETAKQARYTSNRLDGGSHLTGSCSNISCHFGATPKWDPSL